jgi:type IV secretion system protein VirB9
LALPITALADTRAQLYLQAVKIGAVMQATSQRLAVERIVKLYDEQHDGAYKPIAMPNGEILYPYGSVWPTVVCSPLHACIIVLGKGQKIINVALGNNPGWASMPMRTKQRQEIVLKPKGSGPEYSTNLTFTTQNHTYYLNLVSDKSAYVPMVGFYYPDQLVQNWAKKYHTMNEQADKAKALTVGTLPNLSVSNLDFSWHWHGNGAKPLRVFSANDHTYIQIPKVNNAPVIFAHYAGKDILINYQYKAPYYVLDAVPHEIVMVSGVGSHKKQEVIKQGPANTSWW